MRPVPCDITHVMDHGSHGKTLEGQELHVVSEEKINQKQFI